MEKNLKRCLEAYETSAGKQTQHGIQMVLSLFLADVYVLFY